MSAHAVQIPDQIDLLDRTDTGVECAGITFEFDVAGVWSAGLAAGLELVDSGHALITFSADDGTQYVAMACGGILYGDGAVVPLADAEVMLSFTPVERPKYPMYPISLVKYGTHINYIAEKWTGGQLHAAAVLSVFITAMRVATIAEAKKRAAA